MVVYSILRYASPDVNGCSSPDVCSASAASKVFCMSRVDRTTNNDYPAIELVSGRIRVSPHVTLPRAGTLAPWLVSSQEVPQRRYHRARSYAERSIGTRCT